MDSPPNGPCQVVITAPDRAWLQSFVRSLVDDHLAAAAHVDVMHTTYRWAGQVQEAEEARAILHTTFSRVDDIAALTRCAHPYEVACVAAVPIAAGEVNYLQWISDSSV